MKKYNNIDEFFKEEISDYTVTPSDRVWKNIESEYFKSNAFGRRNVMILALISLFIIIGGVFTWNMFINTTEQSNIVTSTKKEVRTTKSAEIAENNNEIKSDQTSETGIVNDKTSYNADNKNDNQILYTQITTTNNLTNDIRENTELLNSSNSQLKTNEVLQIDFNTKLNLSSSFQLNKLIKRNTTTIQNFYRPSLIYKLDKITVDEYIERRKNMHFYTGVSASIGVTYYSATTDQTTWTADLVYGLKLKGYYIETGIGFQKMKEQGNFQIEYKTNDSIGYYNKVVSFELNPNNPGEITYKTLITTVFDSIKHHLLQSPLYYYDYIVIPIKFGYSFFQKTKFSVSAETGIIYSYLTKIHTPKIQYNDPESQLIGITNNTPKRVDHNFRFHIALRLNYNITKTVTFSAQPEFTSFINSIYKESYNSKVRPYTMGLRFGICFDF